MSKGHLWRVAGAYVAVFAVFFFGIRHGVGQYWDWSFPYFRDQMPNFFFGKDSSLIRQGMGTGLGYSTDYFLRFVVALGMFLQPETWRYVLMVAIFALGAFGMYLLARRHTSPLLSFLLGLVVFINPAIFYKYTAGHFNYLVAFTIFIYLFYYLFYKFEKTLRSAIIVGLFIAALGVQIQFFVIGGIFLAVFFSFNRDKLSIKYAAVMLGLPFLIHLVWLCCFLTGANSTTETSNAAAQVSFKSSSSSNFLSIFTFNFSAATLLSKFYAFYELLWSAALFIFMLWLLMHEKHKQKIDVLLLVFLAIMVFMATGLYQQISLGPLTVLYPMLREVGHFAPVIVLVVALLVARLVRYSSWRWLLVIVLTGSLFIVGVKFQYFSQGYSFAKARQQFAPFKQIADSDKSNYRILAYPFFDKYSFNFLPGSGSRSTLPLTNSGHDSFASFSTQDYVQNAVPPYEFKDSVQYKLLQSYDINVLRPYNVKYIFDFSSIYGTTYEHYVPPATYNNDVNLIRSDTHFLDKLLANNPGKLRRVNAHVLEVVNYEPHVYATNKVFGVSKEDFGLDSSSFVSRGLKQKLDYATDGKPAKYATQLTPLFSDPSKVNVDKQTGSFSQTVQTGKNKATMYVNTSYAAVWYQLTNKQLTIYADNPGTMLLNNRAVTSGSGKQTLMQMPVTSKQQYYVSFAGTITPAKQGAPQRLGIGKEGTNFEVLTDDGSNLVQNNSFEQGLWRNKVTDCNNYDSNGKIAMSQNTQTASDGKASLQLEATRHDACTSTDLAVQPNTQYLLSFDYQSPDAQTANFYLSYTHDDEHFAKGFRAINDTQWHTLTKVITTPANQTKARLYLYANEQDQQHNIINRYDNVSMVKLKQLDGGSIPTQSDPYKAIPLAANSTQNFSYTDSSTNYTNLVSNGSFEQGPWQPQVSDCNNYDAQANIQMRIDTSDASDGKQSLELSAKHHDACERNTANIAEDTDYVLSFDYKTNGAKYYGYAASFDDPENTVNHDQLVADKGNGWHHATIKIHTPKDASTMTFYLYAFEGQKRTNIVHYDNVAVTQMPGFDDHFYVVQDPEVPTSAPASTTFETRKPYEDTIHIKGAKTPFFLNLSENYHPKWQLELNNSEVSGLSSLSPSTAATTVADHFKTNGFGNGWLIDPAALCNSNGKLRAGCTQNSDGSYNIELKAEFTPQRWFVICVAVSWAAVIGSAIYLTATRGRNMPTYQLATKQWHRFVRGRK